MKTTEIVLFLAAFVGWLILLVSLFDKLLTWRQATKLKATQAYQARLKQELQQSAMYDDVKKILERTHAIDDTLDTVCRTLRDNRVASFFDGSNQAKSTKTRGQANASKN